MMTGLTGPRTTVISSVESRSRVYARVEEIKHSALITTKLSPVSPVQCMASALTWTFMAGLKTGLTVPNPGPPCRRRQRMLRSAWRSHGAGVP